MEALTVCPSTLAEGFNRSFLSERLKRYYWQSYNYRRTTLTPYHGE